MLAIIGGSGFDKWDNWKVIKKQEFSTKYGAPSAPLVFGEINNAPCVMLSRHGNPHHIPPHKINYRANIQALYECGVKEIIALAAVGGIDERLHEPCLIVPHDILDYTYGREHTYSDGYNDLQHIDFTWPYSEKLRQQLIDAAVKAAVPCVKQAVYAVTQGPRLETAAEVRKIKNDGGNIIGMTGMPEAALARELGLEYACLAISVNAAAGCVPEIITIQQIMKNLEIGKRYVKAIFEHLQANN